MGDLRSIIVAALLQWLSWHASASFPDDYLFAIPAGVVDALVYIAVRELIDGTWRGVEVFPKWDRRFGLLDINLAGIVLICILTAMLVGVDFRLSVLLGWLGPTAFPALSQAIERALLRLAGEGRAEES